MNFTDDAIKVSQHFNVREVGLIKLYLLVIGIILSLWVPSLTNVPFWVYLLLAAVLLGPLMVQEFQKHGNYIAKIFSGKNVHLFKDRGFNEFGLFKSGMVLIGLLFAQLFPVLLTIHIGWYLAVWGFGAGYFVARMVRK